MDLILLGWILTSKSMFCWQFGGRKFPFLFGQQIFRSITQLWAK